MQIWEVTSSRWLRLASYQFLLPLLRRQGVDVGTTELTRPLPRGIPAYVTHDADVDRVQRAMARGLIRTVFVLRNDRVVGAVEITDLVARGEKVWEDKRPRRALSFPPHGARRSPARQGAR